jgi:riboflavin kinase / FMN adenylyltransferase
MAEAAGLHVVDGLDALRRADGRLFVVLGAFDGLHRGHLYLLRALRREARARTSRPTVVTFDAHPDEIIQGRAPAVLCDPEERLVRFARAGVEVVVIAHFDARVRATPYDEFVRSIRLRVDLAGFLMTPAAAFGYERRGTVDTVGAMGAREGFDVAVVPDLALDGRAVGSSAIRDAIAAGDLTEARRLLGRRVAVTGRVGEPSGGGPASRVTFAAPVALPPPGRYRASVGPAWALGQPSRMRAVERTVRVVAGEVLIERPIPFPADERLRIALRERA